jgi:hypothetical protein
LEEQVNLHESYTASQDSNRRKGVYKWALSIGAGLLAGTAVAFLGLDKLKHAKEATAAAQAALENAIQPSPTPDVPHVAEVATTAVEEVANYKEVAHSGDGLWNMIAELAHNHLGKGFDNLDSAHKTFFIDVIKDRVAANPSEFGLTDIHHIDLNQTVDFGPAFQGPDAIHLPDLVTHTKEISQTMVDSINHNDAIIANWVSTHPGEAWNDNIINSLTHGIGSTTPETPSQVAEFFGASSKDVNTALIDHLTLRQAIENGTLNSELYAKAHELNPTVFPDTAVGSTEISPPLASDSLTAVHEQLSTSNLNALDKSMQVFNGMSHSNDSREALHTISEMKFSDAIKPNTVSPLLEKAGVSYKDAHDTEANMRKVLTDLKDIAGSENMKVKKLFSWMHNRI